MEKPAVRLMYSNTIHFETLGCRLNQDESEGAARSFFNCGYSCTMEAVTSSAETDESTLLCIINTCTVTNKAEQKARRIIRMCLEKYPHSAVCVTGCYAELDGDSIKAMCPERVSIIPGTKKYVLNKIAENLKKLVGAAGFIDDISRLDDFIKLHCSVSAPPVQSALVNHKDTVAAKVQIPLPFTLYTPVFEKHSRASLKIQDGCNNSCTFCRIHFARGKSVSLGLDEVLNRVREIEASGKDEVVFTGVNLSQYAGDFYDGETPVKKDFAFLLKYLIENTKKIKFRISSFYPQSVTDSLCESLKSDRVQPFFHLSVQSGSDSVLKAMKRPYGHDDVVNAVKKIRNAKKDCFISCDIIAGFPGESDFDFNETVRLCEECSFSWMHVFPFSPRPGTEAAVMKPQITEAVKTRRAAVLGKIAVDSKIKYIESMKGREFTAVVENSRALRLSLRILKNTSAGSESGIYHAVTDNFIHVEFKSSRYIESSRSVRVRIDQVLEDNIRTGKEIECLSSLVSVNSQM
ncbi:tRNA (N(6)-L-threonylcarbamoyladenosine(37)-C(2))-methylthiotransferase MtaB [Treponema sp.]|uniref:tRNA (N(6)-L-threonylcarbamoyladenosine(37)-C(2))- methylthiotransferase MtaB n=1 Tax=Treponema sp. TaxID=166 RepID=UPI00257CB2FB|nr:tRNA (N(6)-L-threonylcarbamoyladenosine(37)-C(2))-methylthiotransferase MtaB [Treponema sp.]MBE6354602.1 tRNA (N(6)-L-threonylcarbamoyladenosine(37)-C(2))-methylthiotransferase MtaB [Treponema sp.]